MIFDTATKEAHCLKGLAAWVFNHADGRRSAPELADAAATDLGEVVTADVVADVIAQLEEYALLEVPLVLHDGLSRRELVRRSAFAGAATAFAAPLITSILAPTAAMAASGIPTGCTGCGQNKDCASNHCCQNVPGKQCNQTCCVGLNNSCQIDANNNCTVNLVGCGTLVCPPTTSKCCV